MLLLVCVDEKKSFTPWHWNAIVAATAAIYYCEDKRGNSKFIIVKISLFGGSGDMIFEDLCAGNITINNQIAGHTLYVQLQQMKKFWSDCWHNISYV